jgi:nitrate reductase (cytochrome), electron transfer subunit
MRVPRREGMRPTMRPFLLILALLVCAVTAGAVEINGLRGPTPLTENAAPPPIPNWVNDDKRRVRNYPEQPPVIPHTIEAYQITSNANKCLSCHARQFTGQSGAPMISVTHFMDRDGQVLASVSPRRYFCTQCHVPQQDAAPIIENRFVDVDTLLNPNARPAPR